MTAHTITTASVQTLQVILLVAADRLAALHTEAAAGEIAPAEAAAEIAEIIANINAAAR